MSEYDLYYNLILESIKKIEKTDICSISDDLVWDATLMRLQVIGESVGDIPNDIKKRFDFLNWNKLERLRNLISHKYAMVPPEIIREIIANDLPKLKQAIIKLKK